MGFSQSFADKLEDVQEAPSSLFSLTEDTFMFGGNTLVRTGLGANQEGPWWLPGNGLMLDVPPVYARKAEEEEVEGAEDGDEEDDDEDDDFDDDLEDEEFDEEELDEDDLEDEDFDDLDDEDFDDLDDEEFDDEEDDDDDDDDDEEEEEIGEAP